MRRSLVAALASAVLGVCVAQAAPRPYAAPMDARIRVIPYDPDQVVLLREFFGFQTMIQFGPDERIENVSIGDGAGWQVTPNKRASLLFIKPVETAARTNMTVVTDRRSYLFDLTARRSGDARGADIPYVVRFLYPAEKAAVATLESAAPAAPERRNTAYSYTGSRASLPAVVFDDGRFTYFRWPEAVSTPAIFLLAPDGSESLLNYSVHDGYLVIEQTAQRFILRDGKNVTTVFNEAWREPTPGADAPKPHDAKTAKAAARAEGQP